MFQDSTSFQEGLNTSVYLGTAVFLMLVLLFILFIVMSVRKRKKMILAQEKLKEHYSQEILRTQLEIQEQTLKTVAQEIHDNIGQALSLAKLNLNTMETEKQEELVIKIQNSKELVGKAIRDLRDLSRTMNTDHISSMGLLRSIDAELDLLRKSGYLTKTDITGTEFKLEASRELILFRIVQECFNNIIKHAEAKTVTVAADFSVTELQLKVKDNGKGFDPHNNRTEPGGQGLRNIQSRATMIGAVSRIESASGKGTTIILTIPRDNPVKLGI